MTGDRRRGRGALPSPRVGRMSRRATGGPRWMAISEVHFGARQDRTRLTDRLVDHDPRYWHPGRRAIPRSPRSQAEAPDAMSPRFALALVLGSALR